MEQGRKVNRTELAEVFGIAMTTVDAWVRAGCPFVQRAGSGRTWVFNTADVMRWREERAAEAAGGDSPDEAALKLRKLHAETVSAELELAKQRGLVAPIAEMQRAWMRVVAEVQANLRGTLVTRLTAQLIGETDERRFKRVALAEVDTVLVTLANLDVSEDEAEDGADGGGDG